MSGDTTLTTHGHSKEEEKLFLLMQEKCPICECDIWEVRRTIYNNRTGVASCANCGHLSWFNFFMNGQPKGREISKVDVDFLLFKID